MKTQSKLSAGIDGCGLALVILGMFVLVGWHTHSLVLIKIRPFFSPMVYNSALCFVLSGIGLILLNKKKIRGVRAVSILLFMFASLTICEYFFNINLKIDNLFMNSYLPESDGRMNINATVSFFSTSLALALLSWPYSKARLLMSLLLTLVVLSIGFFGVLSYQFNLINYFGPELFMALHSAFGFIIMGTGLMMWVCLTRAPGQYVPLLPLSLTFFILMITAFSWKMINHMEKNYLRDIIILKADQANKFIKWGLLDRIDAIRHLSMLGVSQQEWKSEALRYMNEQPGYHSIQLFDKDAAQHWIVPESAKEQIIASFPSQMNFNKNIPESEQISLIPGGSGFLLVSPLFKKQQPAGNVIADINIQQFFDYLFTLALGNDYTLRVYENSQLIYSHGSIKPSIQNKWQETTSFSLLGKKWQIKVGPSLILYKHIRTTIFSSLILIIGSLIAILSGFLLRLYQDLKWHTTKLNETRLHLARANDQFKGIIEGSNDLIAALDLNYNFITFNTMYKKEVHRLFKIDLDFGMNFSVLLNKMSSKNQQKALSLWKKAFEGHTFTVIESFQDKKFKDLNYEIHYNPIYDQQGKLIGASHIANNVSKRIISEKRLLTSKDELERAVQRLETQNNELKLLKEMMSLLQSSVSMNDAVDAIASYVKIVLNGTSGVVYLMSPDAHDFNKILTWGEPLVNLSIIKKNECWCLMRGQLHQVLKVENGVLCQHVKAAVDKPEAYLCCPLHVQGDVFGLFYIEVTDSLLMTQHLTYVSQLMSEQIGLSLFNIQLRERLQTQSTHDSLTGLYNRLFLENYINSTLKGKRNSPHFALLLIDVDFFKKINDTFGHLMGDEVLTAIAEQLSSRCNANDLICRWGGEEFLIYLSESDSKKVKARAENLRYSIEEMTLVINEIPLPKLSISIGVAFYPKDGKDLNHLLIKADEALYHAKKMGRNRVIMNSI